MFQRKLRQICQQKQI